MNVTAFGIRLIRLTHAHIELVRQHRNSASIRQYMEYREEITPEMQEAWFRSIDNEFNNYFMIESGGRYVGLIYGAQIDWEKKETGNGGIFIWAEDVRQTPVPLAASLVLTDLSFIIGLERTYIKVLRDNLNAVAFNRNLGYVPEPGQDDVLNQRYVLTKANYERKAERFRRPFVQQYGDVFTAVLDNPEHPASRKILQVYPQLPEENRRRVQLIVTGN